MTDQREQAYQEAEGATSHGVAEMIERVADKVGLNAGARAVFGEPVERAGLTIIPVAQVIFGTGGGGGSDAAGEAGTGAGGGALTRPLGYIEIGEDGAVFRQLRQPWQDAGLIVSVAFAGLLLAKAVRTLARG